MAEKKRNPQPTRRRRKPAKPSATKTLAQLFKQRKRRGDLDFKPDVQKGTWVKTARLTKQQQLRLIRWVLYVTTVVACLADSLPQHAPSPRARTPHPTVQGSL